jgi:hypothetical protein
MAVIYEVLDFETNNIINSFETEAAALQFLRRLLDLNGPNGVREMGIVRQATDATGEYEPTLILDGPALLARLGKASGTSHSEPRRAGG